jgi:hypothetical protein
MAVNNVTATIGTNYTSISVNNFQKKMYGRINFSEWDIDLYKVDQMDPVPSGTIPIGGSSSTSPAYIPNADKSFLFWPMENFIKHIQTVVGPTYNIPQFVSPSENIRSSFRKKASGFATNRFSIMPKLIIPTSGLIANGLEIGGSAVRAEVSVGGNIYDLFNWKIDGIDDPAEIARKIKPSEQVNAKYISMTSKSNSTPESIITATLEDPSADKGPWNIPSTQTPPAGWEPLEQIVGKGAFCFMINIIPFESANTDPEQEDIDGNTESMWSIELIAGEVKINITEAGKMIVDVAGQITEAQAPQASGAELPAQATQLKGSAGGTLYVLVVYPVWNGVVISSGIQDLSKQIDSSAVFCPKKGGDNTDIFDYFDAGNTIPPQKYPFDVTAPAPVNILSPDDVKVNFGDKVILKLIDCRADFCYVPVFFMGGFMFDAFFLAPKDELASLTFDYQVFPVWTSNGTSHTITNDIYDGYEPSDRNVFKRIVFTSLNPSGRPTRYAPELFSMILETEETNWNLPRNGNGNGNFASINWTGGSTGVPVGGAVPTGADWPNYITAINVTSSLDGLSGSITIDKYGLAGQKAVVEQAIGAITIDMNNATIDPNLPDWVYEGTDDVYDGMISNRIFTGYGVGITENDSPSGSTWTIPLEGLQKKLGDLIVVNAPFFDGEKLSEAIYFLQTYGGFLVSDQWATTDDRLPQSFDIENPIMNFRSGTSVLDNVNMTMQNSQHSYVIQKDGEMWLYKLNDVTSLPQDLNSFTDWLPFYPNTKIMSVDRNPDFADLRNELVVMALQDMGGGGTNPQDNQFMPLVKLLQNATTPDIPWSKMLMQPVEGIMDQADIDDIADKFKASISKYEIVGKVSVLGNPSIKPYDRWGDKVVTSVSHSIDFTGKTWTTDVELASGE